MGKPQVINSDQSCQFGSAPKARLVVNKPVMSMILYGQKAKVMNFSKYASEYCRFRPKYPEEMFTFLSEACKERESVLDCGTGNGQAAIELAKYFKHVIASDISTEQIALADIKSNIQYICCPAEKIDLLDNSTDLITSAQAMHWFDLDKFYKEIIRIAKPKAILAAWCYTLPTIADQIDSILLELYAILMQSSSHMIQIKYVHDCYETIPFPFDKINVPKFFMKEKWDYWTLVGHLKTWPSVKKYRAKFGESSLDHFFEELRFQWGRVQRKFSVTWPLHLIVGKIKG